jgi:hypothetical protein
VTGVENETADVFTVKVAVDDPAATVTLVSTVAAPLLLESETNAPPVGAAAVSVTVPWDVLPPTTVVGLRAIEDKAAGTGLTVNEAVRVTPL